MKTEQIKVFTSTKDLLEHYSHITTEKKNEIGHKHFMIPIEHQLKWFNDGLGSITYFETIKNDKISEIKGEHLYRMHMEYVKNLKMGEIKDNEITEPSYIKADGFDDCLIGLGFKFGNRGTLIYDQAKVIQKLIDDSEGKMTEDEAFEYYEFNILGAYVGENMPIFVESCTMNDIQEMIEEDCPENECCGGGCHQTDS
jgi:hypothetical protein